ncbi:MAG: nicotinate-nucleotide adenylyltransferase [Alphaproteobacteria bacterium]
MASRGLRIGLLGGSFNPAHRGHRLISLFALQRLALDQVWWLVSPQNPLKPRTDMASLSARIAKASQVAGHPRIRVTALEAALGTRYTVDTLRALKSRAPGTVFVWLMGADNLEQISAWRAWPTIFHLVPIAVFDRPRCAYRALAGKAAQRFASSRVAASAAPTLAGRTPPAWIFFRQRLADISATEIRRRSLSTTTASQGDRHRRKA